MPCKKTANRSRTKHASRSKAVKRALKISARFYGFSPRRIQLMAWKWPKALAHLGRCSQLNYVSDKFDGKVREYFHQFENNAQVFTADSPQRNGDRLLIIRGRFKVKDEGIIG